MAEVEQEFRKTVVALVRIGVHGLFKRAIDPRRHLAAAKRGGTVSQLAELRSRPGLRRLRAVGQPSGEHLIGDDAERKLVRARGGLLAEKIFRRGILRGAEDVVAVAGWRGLGDAGDPGGAE